MSQVTPVMPTTGVYSGLQAAGYINAGFATLNTRWLGSSAPSDAPNGIPAAGQNWVDSSASGYQLVKGYDGAAWVLEHAIDTVNHILLNPIGGGTASIASASTTDLGSKNEAYQSITGTTTITSFGSNVSAGQIKVLTFGGSLTLTYNATSMILPGAANIQTSAGDTAIMISLGSGNWKCLAYGRISGSQLSMTGAAQTVASASTTDLASGGSNAVVVSGTTTITSFGSNATTANPYYFVRFSGALILTHNATSLIIPGGQNVTTSAGDYLIAEYLGSGNWRVDNYMRANGQVISMTGGDTTIASATTTNLGSTGSNIVNVSGTTTITGFGSSASTANPVYIVRFTGALQLTYNGTSMILPASNNITTAAGDTAIMLYLGSGNWRCLNYSKADGSALTGSSAGVRSTYQGLSAAWATNTTLTVTFQQMLLQNSGGASYTAAASGGLTLNSATSGAGGIDTGSVANNTWYYIYVIYNGTDVKLLMSTSATAPTLPSGYTYYSSPISAVKTNGSAQFIGFIQKGDRWAYQIGSNLSAMPLIASTSTGNVNTPTWTAEAVASFVPTSLAGAISLQQKDWSNGANTAICAPNNSYGGNGSTTNPPPMITDGAANADILMDMVLESTNIYYASNGSISLYCRGFILNI